MRSYHQLLEHVLAKGRPHKDRTGVGTTSVFGHQWRHDMSEGFPLLTTKKLPFRWIAEELFWFLSGSHDEKALRAKGVDLWKEWSTSEQCAKFGRQEGDLGPIYGALWRNFGGWDHEENKNVLGAGVDQIAKMLRNLERSPDSRRLIVTGWDPESEDKVALPPCHTLWQLKAYDDGGLSLQLYQRSADLFLGVPFNIASYALLLHMLCFVSGRTPVELVISFGDLHVYNNHRDAVRTQLQRLPYKLPTLEIVADKKETWLDTLLSLKYENLHLKGYQHHPKIEAPVAV
jgi:thymidylate synthase